MRSFRGPATVCGVGCESVGLFCGSGCVEVEGLPGFRILTL